MSITLQWHHLILAAGPILSLYWIHLYNKDTMVTRDTYGVIAVICLFFIIITNLLTSVVWLFLKYLGVI